MESSKRKKMKKDYLPQDKLTEDSHENIDDSDEEMKQESGSDHEKEIEIEFEAFEPSEEDFEGIKRMLKQLFLKENLNISEIAKILIENKDFTTIVKQVSFDEEEDDEDEVFGVTSLIDFSDPKYENREALKELRSYLIETSKKSKNEAVQKIIENSKLCLVINERFVNLPPKLCLPSFQELVKVVKQKHLSLENVVMISKVLLPKAKKAKSGENEILFLNPEEELFEEECDFHYSINASDLCDSSCRDGHWDDTDREYTPFRHVLIFTINSWLTAVDNLKNNL